MELGSLVTQDFSTIRLSISIVTFTPNLLSFTDNLATLNTKY